MKARKKTNLLSDLSYAYVPLRDCNSVSVTTEYYGLVCERLLWFVYTGDLSSVLSAHE